MSYIGKQPVPQSLQSRQQFTGDGSTTTFVTIGGVELYEDVFLNGVRLSRVDNEYSFDGTTLTITPAPANGDTVSIILRNDHSELIALPITDSQGNNVLSESGSVVTLSADEANVGSNALVVNSSGNVGVNTSSVVASDVGLEVRDKILAVTASSGDSRIFLGGSTSPNHSAGQIRYDTSGNSLEFYANSAERMRIDSSGKLLVGNPTSNTGIAGTGVKIKSNSVGTTSEAALVLEGTGGDFYAMRTIGTNMYLLSIASSSQDYWSIGSASGTGITILENGQIDLPGTYSNLLTTARDLAIQDGGRIGYTSSVRSSKTNIENLPSIAWIYELNPVKFQYRTKDENNNFTDEAEPEIQYGLIAEDVVEVNSDLVFGDETENGFELRGIQYSRLIAPMIKAIQEQQTLIESQQSQIDALTAKTQEQDLTIASLISRIEALETPAE